jgi:hypothetical protein
LSEVKLEEFLRVVGEDFPNHNNVEKGELQYEECIKHREIWDNLSNMNEDNVRKIVIYFLNKWRCRLPYECAPQLAASLKKAEPLLKPMRNFSIESVNLIPIKAGSKTLRVLELIEKVFEVIQKVKAGKRTVGPTATSKILHMAVPKFFVMYDEKIRKAYGCEGNAKGYVNFMLRMNLLARNLLEQAKGNKEAILACSKWRERTLARLLDNYNYARFSLPKLDLLSNSTCYES